MISLAGDLARRLARDAEAVCRHYLSNGHRQGRYWTAGDVMNTPCRSLYVRLTGPDSGPGAAGKWTDAASPSEHGDLLDLIRLNRNLSGLGEAIDEARRFLALPRPPVPSPTNLGHTPPAASGSSEAARRLFHAGRPVPGTPAEAYLRARGITGRLDGPALRYHPSVYYREAEDAPLQTWPALLAAVTGFDGNNTGIQRTWLDPRRSDKAPLAAPIRALGNLLGNGVRFGMTADILVAGEGIETMLALKSVLASLPMIAGLSASHLAALDLTPAPGSGPGQALRRLYVARDNDAAGLKASQRLHERGAAAGIEIHELVPVYGDFNLDLCRLGPECMRAHLADQLVPSGQPCGVMGSADASPFLHESLFGLGQLVKPVHEVVHLGLLPRDLGVGNYSGNCRFYTSLGRQVEIVLRGLVPRTHGFVTGKGRRGWPGQARPRRE